MTAWYNEIDPYAAQWLRNLIAAGHIAPGEVDERSITEVQPDDLKGFTQCHFFAGVGIWSLALRMAGWPDGRPVWTGSCPCQPFSVAGKQKGFTDERHLWPVWQRLIAERRPPVVFGEQVAAASQWLGLVRGDLEAMGYAVGCEAIQAASAGADHLRDRFWFVGDDTRLGRGEGWSEHEVRCGRPAIAGNGCTGVGQADAYDTGSQGRPLSAECAGERAVGQNGMALTDQPSPSEGREQRSGEQCRSGGYQEACDGGRQGAVSNAECTGDGRRPGEASRAPREVEGEMGQQRVWPEHSSVCGGGSDFDWVIGADGKARRVKPGIRLLVNGHPNRVAKLRAFGNAIDPRPASEWIGAYLDRESVAA
ncbi:MAG: DNA cytosine methyltransferase [Alphaproteobacteria bacterium]|nr:DNA cytosine methyltransferase [Alphaproteobacteria bacterium]